MGPCPVVWVEYRPLWQEGGRKTLTQWQKMKMLILIVRSRYILSGQKSSGALNAPSVYVIHKKNKTSPHYQTSQIINENKEGIQLS